MIKSFLSRYRHLFWLLLYIPQATLFFVTQRMEPVWTVHSRLDDLIPFCKYFIVFYVIWYGYVFFSLFWLGFQNKTDFLRAVFFCLLGVYLSQIFMLFCPTQIDFRGDAYAAEGTDVFSFLVRFIYAHDNPRNVFPSLHCFEAVAIHIVVNHSETGKKIRWYYPISLFTAVMICLSTVFVKQHSVLDLFSGVALALLLVPVVYRIPWKFLRQPEKEQLLAPEPAKR